MQTIAFYGKGGIGKSTVVANISLLFKRSGYKVLQVGCDPKHDSALKHIPSTKIRTVMGEFYKNPKENHNADWLQNLVMVGHNGVHCLETGGPEPGQGCSGRAISIVLDLFKRIPSFYNDYDVVIYDVLGDVVCGGFASPLRSEVPTDVYLVVSGEVMSLYAANNIAKGIVNLSKGKVVVAGLVANLKNMPGEKEIIKNFAEHLGVRITGFIPYDEKVFIAELNGMTVTEMYPKSDIAKFYTQVYQVIVSTKEKDKVIPKPFSQEQFENIHRQHLQYLLKNESFKI